MLLLVIVILLLLIAFGGHHYYPTAGPTIWGVLTVLLILLAVLWIVGVFAPYGYPRYW